MANYGDIIDEEQNETLGSSAPANPYASVIDEDDNDGVSQLKQSMFVAAEKDPDRHAKVISLSNQVGLPTNFVEQNFDDIKKKADYSFANADFLKSSPAVGKFLQDPNNAALMKDDIPAAQKIEQRVKDLSLSELVVNSAKAALINATARIAKIPAALDAGITNLDNLRIEGNNRIATEMGQGQLIEQKGFRTTGLLDNDFVRERDRRAQAANELVPEIGQDVVDAAMSGNFKQAGRILLAQSIQSIPDFMTMLAMGHPGLLYAGATTAAGAIGENVANPNLTEEAAAQNAGLKGLAEVGGEYVGTILPTKIIGNAVGRVLDKRIASEVMKEFTQSILSTTGLNFAEEAATQVAQDLVDYQTGADPNAIEGIGKRALSAGIGGAAFGFGVASPSITLQAVSRQAELSHINASKDLVLGLAKDVRESKLFKRSPERAEALIKTTVEGTPNEFVYLEADKVDDYYQSKGINPVAIMTDLGLLQSYNDAKEAGVEIKIPTEKFVSQMLSDGNEKLAEYMRLGVNSNSLESSRQLDSEMQTAANAIPADTVAQSEIEDDVRARVGQLVDQQRALNPQFSIDDRQVEAFVKVASAQAATRAADLGISTQEAIEQMPLFQMMRAQSLSEGELAQGDIKTPDFSTFESERAEEFFKQPEVKAQYLSRPETMGGKRLDSDVARELMPEYANGREGRMVYSDLTDRAVGLMMKEIYEEKLQAEPQGKVWLMAGGPGSGKSEVFNRLGESVTGAEIIYDSVSSNVEIAKQRVAQALESGRPVEIKYVYTPIEQAMGWIEKRFKNDGRPVDTEWAVKAHINALETILALADEYSADPRVEIQIYDNSRNVREDSLTIEDLRALRYIKDGETVEEAAERLLPDARERLKNVERETDQVRKSARARFEASRNSRETEAQSRAQYRGIQEGLSGEPQGNVAGRRESGEVNQGGSAPRGSYSPMSNILKLAAEGDISTLLHEMTHFWAFQLANDHSYLKTLTDTSAGEQRRVKLGDDLLKWLGIESFDQMTREHHERLAETGEAYFMTGKAPTQGMRKVFNQLRVWMTQVYKHISALGRTVDPEIRNFFDRMIVGDEELALTEQSSGLSPLFGYNAEKFGLTGENARKYADAVEATKIEAREILTTQFMEQFQRQRESFYKEQRQANRERIAAEVGNMPAYKALQILQRAQLPNGQPTDPIKLSKEILKSAFDPDVVKRLPRGISIKEDGIHPDVAAELFGFRNGAELIYQLAALENKTELVERMTDEHMAKAYPDLIDNPEGVRAQAMEALHNVPKAKLLRLELELMATNQLSALKSAIRQTARRVPTEAEVRKSAEDMIGRKLVADIRPIEYLRAEVKSANEAGKALARGDLDAAYEFKRKELLNHELYRASNAARESIDKHLERFKRFRKSDEDLAKSRDVNLVNAGRAVLAVYGLSPVSDKEAADYLKAIKEYDPQAFEGVMAQVMSAIEGAGNYRQITFDKFTDMATTVQALWDLSRSNRQMEIDGKKLDLQDIQVQLQGRLLEYQGADKRVDYERAAGAWDKIKVGLLGVKAALTRVEYWAKVVDGGEVGPFTKYIWQPISEASTKFRLERTNVMAKYRELVKEVRPRLDQKAIRADEFGYEFKNKAELLGALLHTGNNSNMKKMIVGYGWGQQFDDGTFDRTKWDRFVARMWGDGTLNKQDYDFVQGVWDLFESLKSDTQKAHKSIYGFHFNEITANPIDTPFGQFRGGYAPAKGDPYKNQDAALNRDREGLETEPTSFVFPSTGKGATLSRKENYAGKLSFNLDLVKTHIDWSMRFTYLQPTVNQVARIVTNRAFNKALEAVDPTVRTDMLVPWLQRAAKQTISTPSQGSGGKALDYVARALRSRTGFGMMVLNVVNTLQQVSTIPMSLLNIDAKALRNGFARTIMSPKTTAADVAEKSEYMRTRLDNQVQAINGEINDLLVSPGKFEELKAFTEKHGYILQSGLQNLMDISVWVAGYDQSVEQGMNEKEAVRFADSQVRTTQNSYAPEDVSRFETGSPFARVFTQFYSFFNNWANLNAAEMQIAINEMGLKKSAGRLVFIYMLGFALPNILNDAIMRALSGKGLDEDDDDDYVDDVLDVLFGSQFRTLTAMVPGVGPTIRAGFNTYNKKPYDDRISASPALSMLESTGKTLVGKPFIDLAEGRNPKGAIRDVLSTISLLSGIPVAPLSKPLGYLSDVRTGRAAPTGPIDFTRGLVTGR